ncbi:MAG: hypothetical protein VCE74_06475, partial [Alphaproteobacteria bacterium]
SGHSAYPNPVQFHASNGSCRSAIIKVINFFGFWPDAIGLWYNVWPYIAKETWDMAESFSNKNVLIVAAIIGGGVLLLGLLGIWNTV